MKILIIIVIVLLIAIINYLLITLIVDFIVMGKVSFRVSKTKHKDKFVIKNKNKIDIQTGFKCSAFASAYLLRHLNIDANGDEIYNVIPHKMKSGYVYPKGIADLFKEKGFNVCYYSGNLNTLKHDLENSGNPIIVMIRIQKDKNYLHYVPVVGFDENNIFIAESLAELVNDNNELHNRKIGNKEFLKLWNTSMLRQPLYKNTYFVTSNK